MPEDDQDWETAPDDFTNALPDEANEGEYEYEAEEEDHADASDSVAESATEEASEPVIDPASAPFRPNLPSVGQGGGAEAYLREVLGDELFQQIDAHFSARYASAQVAATASDYYVGQVEASAPGFLGVEQRAYLRQLPAQAQSDPAAVLVAAITPYLAKVQQTGDVTAALDAFASEWHSRRGRASSRPAPPVLPPTQRVASVSPGGGGSVMRPARAARPSGASGTISALLGLSESEAQQFIRESRKG